MGRLSIIGPHGYHEETGPDIRPKENDTYTCSHCGGIKLVRSKNDPEFRCKRCMGRVCGMCSPKGACNGVDNLNREEWIRKIEENYYRISQRKMVGG